MKLSRARYKAIKKLSRSEMEMFLTNLYKNSYVDGTEDSSNVDFRIKLVGILENTKGVGATLFNRIMEQAKEEM